MLLMQEQSLSTHSLAAARAEVFQACSLPVPGVDWAWPLSKRSIPLAIWMWAPTRRMTAASTRTRRAWVLSVTESANCSVLPGWSYVGRRTSTTGPSLWWSAAPRPLRLTAASASAGTQRLGEPRVALRHSQILLRCRGTSRAARLYQGRGSRCSWRLRELGSRSWVHLTRSRDSQPVGNA